MHFFPLFPSVSHSVNKSGAGAGTIEIGYLFYENKKKSTEKKWKNTNFDKKFVLFRFICLVWCWHSDLELCVVIFCVCLSFVCVFFSLSLSRWISYLGVPIMTVCFYKVEIKKFDFVWMYVRLCPSILPHRRRGPKNRNENISQVFVFQPVFNFQSVVLKRKKHTHTQMYHWPTAQRVRDWNTPKVRSGMRQNEQWDDI